MKIKCRNFEGEILLLEANTEEYCLCQEPRTVVSSYDLKFVQETGEIIEIRGVLPSDFEIVKE